MDGNVSCHWPPMIWGEGEGTFVQPPKTRFVLNCGVKPAEASGQVMVKFPGVVAMLRIGLAVLNAWFGPSASVAAISAGDRATL